MEASLVISNVAVTGVEMTESFGSARTSLLEASGGRVPSFRVAPTTSEAEPRDRPRIKEGKCLFVEGKWETLA